MNYEFHQAPSTTHRGVRFGADPSGQQNPSPRPDEVVTLHNAITTTFGAIDGGPLYYDQSKWVTRIGQGFFTPKDQEIANKIMSEYKITPRSSLDRVFCSTDSSGNFISRYGWVSVVPYPKETYWNLLRGAEKPEDYIRYLAAWPAFGIALYGTPWGIADDYLDYPNHRGINLSIGILSPSVEDRKNYEQYIQQFYSVVLYDYLVKSFTALHLSGQEDKATLENAWVHILNTQLIPNMSGLPTYIDNEPIITIENGGKAIYRIRGGVPNFLSTNFNGPTGVQVMGLRDGLKMMLADAMTLLKMQEPKVGAWVAALSDPTTPLSRSPYANDPYFNLFLIWTGVKDSKTGMPVFKNVARNLSAGWEQVRAKEVTALYGPNAKQYESVKTLREFYIRNIPIEGGGTLSQFDLLNQGKLPQKSDVAKYLLIAGGVAAAAIASQYT